MIVVSITAKSQNNCTSIKKEIDKFTGQVTYSSPLLKSVHFYRVFEDTLDLIYLTLRCNGATLNTNEKGVIVLFDDGSKWEKPEQTIKVNVADEGWEYRAFIPIQKEDLKLFSEKLITDFRLYIYDKSVFKSQAKKYMNWAKCMLEISR